MDQRILLQNVYRTAYSAANRVAIQDSALVRAYAKSLLGALVLHVVFSKLERLIEMAPGALLRVDRARLVKGLKRVRTLIAGTADPNTADAIRSAITHFARFMAIFHDGDATASALAYRPITGRPIQHLVNDPTLSTAGMRELAVATGLIGVGMEQGNWSIGIIDLADPKAGAFQITSGARTTKAYVVSNATAVTRLNLNGHIDDGDDAILIYALDIAPAMARSPRARRSRTGVPGTREVSISTLLVEVADGTELMQRFREELSF